MENHRFVLRSSIFTRYGYACLQLRPLSFVYGFWLRSNSRCPAGAVVRSRDIFHLVYSAAGVGNAIQAVELQAVFPVPDTGRIQLVDIIMQPFSAVYFPA